MAQSLGAADIVVSRTGATTILELSALAKPTILIPRAQLAAGHQLKNAAEYSKDGMILVPHQHAESSLDVLLLGCIAKLVT